MYDFQDKTVVFVGGFNGVGYQMCRLLVQKRVRTLCILHRNENVEMMKKLQNENPSCKVMCVKINLMDVTTVEHTMQETCNSLGHIDVLINGMDVLADKDITTTITVNLTSLIRLTLLALPYMDKTQMGRGGIVCNISSVYGLEPGPCFAVYCAAKHGVVGFTRSMADKSICNRTGVTFMCMCPGLTANEIMVNLRENCTWKHSEEYGKAVESAKKQTSEECATQMIKCLETMKNGSMWMINLGQSKEVVPTTYWQLR